MKIIFFDFSTLNYGGGCEKNYMNMGKWFSSRSIETSYITGSYFLNNLYCFCFRQGKHEKNISDNELSQNFGVRKYLTFRLRDIFYLPTNSRKIRDELNSTDFIISKNEIFEILLLRYFFRVKMPKVIFSFQTPVHYPVARNLKSRLHNLIYNSFFYFNLIKNARSRLLTLTQDKRFVSKYGIKARNVIVIPNPLNTAKFSMKSSGKRVKFKIYYIGRMTEQKGVDTLLHVIEKLSKTDLFSESEFFFVGSGDQSHYLEALPKCFENCHYLGFKEDIVKFYQDADLTVVPSRWEGFPYAVLEAQSCGVPVVTTNTAGCKDIVINEETGWICEIDNVGEISTAIATAYRLWSQNYEAYEDMGRKARQNIVDNYDENIINQRILDFILDKPNTL